MHGPTRIFWANRSPFSAQWLVDTIHANPGVALIPTGPMTNIALALLAMRAVRAIQTPLSIFCMDNHYSLMEYAGWHLNGANVYA